MRTTLTIEDPLAKQLKEIAHRSGRSFKRVVNDAIRAGIRDGRIVDASRPYRVVPKSMGKVDSRFNLDKTLELAARLEDEELARKLRLRK
ncbi:MAG: hypothetical protein OXN89_08785 [Bryobacterales bacterium]|nr:hypothetical protein [Bryobacterales bacterium]